MQIIKPEGVISEEREIDLYNTWVEKQTVLLSKAGTGKTIHKETKSFWWSLEDLKNYFAYAESEANKKGYNVTGMRLYLGAYPEKNGENTLFFAPTGYKMSSTASFSNIFAAQEDGDDDGNVPIPPLNRGNGGSGTYP